MSIEIARGCTEGCRFCQAGMIYRPVRERDPEQIVQTVLSAVDKSGQDEVSLTALSTADVSCISPLIKKVSERARAGRRSRSACRRCARTASSQSCSTSSGACGGPASRSRPRRGSQRMRDVMNKNVTEEQLLETAERVFSRGWGKMKLYFMMRAADRDRRRRARHHRHGRRTLEVGRRAAGRGKPAEVVVSVSVHVPKPHTPFQWCAMDDAGTIARKQKILQDDARKVTAREAAHARRRRQRPRGHLRARRSPLGDVLERAWRDGARFDSWDEQLDLPVWERGVRAPLRDRHRRVHRHDPTDARLPWSHIDVGLEDGFLAREYRKALKSRLSPPCGKVAGAFVHPTTSADAKAESRRLVCYDCGVACDMTQMRQERVTFLEELEAAPRRLPVLAHGPLARPDRYRFWFEKVGPVALIGHLDLIRELPRVFRRVGVELAYTGGFHPKPDMTFSPALSLGVMSLEEAVDIKLRAELEPSRLAELCAEMTRRAPLGLTFMRAERLAAGAPSISRRIAGARYAIVASRAALADRLGPGRDVDTFLAERAEQVMSEASIRVRRTVGDLSKMVDVRSYLRALTPLAEGGRRAVARAGLIGDLVGFEAEVIITGGGAAKPIEIAEVALGEQATGLGVQLVRMAMVLGDGAAEPLRDEAPQPAALA
jgi:radical SAM-linked protein